MKKPYLISTYIFVIAICTIVLSILDTTIMIEQKVDRIEQNQKEFIATQDSLLLKIKQINYDR